MTFGYPKLLWLLLLAPAAGVLLWWSFRVKARAMAQFIGMRLLPALTVGLSRTRQKIRAALFVSALALALFALGRPQWGFDLEEARQRGLDIVIAIDTSKSMLADDVPPNRLTRARLAALDLMRAAKSDRLGLVAFAGTAFLQCPLSLDDEAFRQSLDALDVNIIPQGGTAIGEAIQTALSAFKEQTENHKILVLFTDGEDHDSAGSALEAAREAAKAGMRIFTVGVGTPSGELLSSTDPYGNRVFIKDGAGNVVKSRLNESLLQQISKETEGFYLPLAGGTIDLLYERGLAPLPKSEFSAKTMRRYHERFQWFLGAALVLLLVEMFFPERAKVRRPTGSAKQGAVAIIIIVASFATLDARASVNDALQSYKRGKFSKARSEYERLAKKSPDDSRLRFNAGAAAFQDEDYDEALRHFSSSLSARDLKLQQQSYYNLGNTQFRLGDQAKDAKERQQSWEQAIQNYDNALNLDASDADAKFNRSVVQEKLEELKKQQQQQQQDKGDSKDQKDDQQKQDQQKQNEQNQEKKDQEKQKQEQEQSEQQKKEEQEQQQKKQEQAQKNDDNDQQSAQDQRGDKPDQAAEPANFNKVMQMTPQQAAQLLEAQKAEEKTMIFLPQTGRTNKNSKAPQRVLKDW